METQLFSGKETCVALMLLVMVFLGKPILAFSLRESLTYKTLFTSLKFCATKQIRCLCSCFFPNNGLWLVFQKDIFIPLLF